MKLASRLDRIEPFYVMECAKAAVEIARSPASDDPMIFLNIGEPDFTAPPPVLAAARACMDAGRTHYTQATGDPTLRERISRWYRERFDLPIAPTRIVVTAGASAALQLACLALVERGEVLMPDPCSPSNRHLVSAFDGEPVTIPVGPASRYQLDAATVDAHWAIALYIVKEIFPYKQVAFAADLQYALHFEGR